MILKNCNLFIEEIWFRNIMGSIISSYRNSSDKLNVSKDGLKKHLYRCVDSFPQKKNDNLVQEWYKEKINLTNKMFNLKIGRCQKLINLLVKYKTLHHLWFYEDEKLKNDRFNLNLNHLHIPIDRIILSHVRKSNTNDFKSLINNKLQFIDDNNNPWSQLNDYSVYLKFQNLFREESRVYNKSPIFYEIELWNNENKII